MAVRLAKQVMAVRRESLAEGCSWTSPLRIDVALSTWKPISLGVNG